MHPRPTSIIVVLLVLLACSLAAAVVPTTLSYQCVLRDEVGNIQPDGTYSFVFRLYDVETGGTALWEEWQLVPVADGIMNVTLGAVTPITLPFDTQYWLAMAGGVQPELEPRTRLTSAPYAHRAATADIAGSAPADSDWIVTGTNLYSGVSGNVGVGTTTPVDKLEVNGVLRLDRGAGAGNILRFVDGGEMIWALVHRPWVDNNLTIFDEVSNTRSMTFESGTGDVGVKTEHPEADFHVVGDTRLDGGLDVDGGLQVNGEITHSAVTSYYTVQPQDFIPSYPNEYADHVIDEAIYAIAGWGRTFRAPVHLPQGATMISVTHHYTDFSTFANDCELIRQPLNGGTEVMIADVGSLGTAGYGTKTDTSVGHPVIDHSAYTYHVVLGASDEIKTWGIVIEYTTTGGN